MWAIPPLEELYKCIQRPADPIGKRMRAAYFLRHHYSSNSSAEEEKNEDILEEIILNLGTALKIRDHGSLLRHEFAYVMGQIRDPQACSVLEEILSNDDECVMVRHECAEALGAIGSKQSLPLLEKLTNHERFEVSETCRLAVDYMLLKTDVACACMLSPYNSIDPAPAHPSHENLSIEEIGNILRDENNPLFERYRAMFSLRNRGGDDCALELGRALLEDNSSATLRHEVAYVLGQMQRDVSVEALHASLERDNEHRMVRHESAEALGAIEGRWSDCEAVLQKFIKDKDDVVRESCIVALDAADYFGHTQNDIDDEINSTGIAQKEETAYISNQSFTGTKARATNHDIDKSMGEEKLDVSKNHFNVI